MSLTEFIIKKPVSIAMLFLGVLLLGMISLTRLPVELLPDTSSSKITITVNVRGGIPPVEIEDRVTKPVEEAVSDISHLKEMLSMSREGRSVIILKFEPGTDMDFTAMEVRERYDRVKNKLPREVERPVIARYEENDEPIVILAVTSLVYSPEILRKFIDEDIKGKIQKVEGVANIEVYGGRERKILVELSQPGLQAYNIPIEHVVDMLGASNLNVLAGEIKKTKTKSLIRTMGELRDVAEIGKLGIAATPAGNIIRLRDIASVGDSYLEPQSIARVNTDPGVTLYIQKESGANTVKVAESIKQQVASIQKALDKDIKIEDIANQADFIKSAINNVINSLISGAILASVCLWLFLRNLRTTFVIAASIPISVIATFSLMYFAEISLNIMTLSGLALGVGMLVDNSVVVIENIVKKNEHGMELVPSIISGTQEILLAVTASTFTTIIVFLPLVFVNKSIQMLYSGAAYTIVFSLLASLVVAILFIPVIASKIKLAGVTGYQAAESYRGRRQGINNLQSYYRKMFIFVLRNRIKFSIVLLIAFVLSIIGFFRIDKEFISPLEEGRFTIFAKMDAGAKLSLIDEMSEKIENLVDSLSEVKTMSVHAENWSSRVYVTLVPPNRRKRSMEEVINSLRPELKKIEKDYKGGFIYFSESQQSGEARELVVDLFGYDYDVIDKLVSEVGSRISQIPGMVDIKRSIEEGRPEIRILIDRKKTALFGLSVKGISDTLHAQIRGLRATYYRTSGKEIEVIVRLDKKYRDTIDKLKKLTLTGSEGQQIYLEQVCSFNFDIGPAEIWRKDKERMIQVSATSTELSLDKVTGQLKNMFGTISFPKDYFYRFGGSYEIMQQNKRELFFALALTLLLVYMTMASLYESYGKPLIIMFTIPMAMMGVVAALEITRKPINIGVAIGAMVLGGIAVNNAIILIDHISLLRESGSSLYKAVIKGSQDRLRPVLITSLTTILGVIPLALSRSEGSTFWSPLGITIFSGMISSTFLTLFVIPIIYILFENIRFAVVQKNFNSNKL